MPDDNPILNGPYDEPSRYYRTLPDGTLDYTKTKRGRRPYDPRINTPIPVKQGPQGQIFDQEDLQEGGENHIINLLRREVGQWRAAQYPNVTRVTRELLLFWFENPERHETKKLFFAQREAVETAIWLNEVASLSNVGQSILNRLKEGNFVSENGGSYNLPRIAFKMATGTGKTVVMAMMIMYHYFNRREYRSDTRFADYFLIVTPGITIKTRLGVLFVDDKSKNPQEINDYYYVRGLVPEYYKNDLAGINSRLIITNYHTFELRNLQGNKRSPFDGKLDTDGNKVKAKENDSQMIKRVLRNFKRDTRLLVINDEAHHCYLPKGKSDQESKEENERAAIWISGLANISNFYKIAAIYDLSATPYFLSGSGYPAYSLFPWVVSDFGLIESIEAGLVKIPFLPESDTTHQLEMPVLRNLYEHVKKDLPKKGKSKEVLTGPPQLPPIIKQAIDQFYSHYKDDYNKIGAMFDAPPVFIVVCNNTNVSSEVYKHIAGYDKLDEEGNIITTVPSKFSLFSNYDPLTGKPHLKPPTLLIDSYALEDSDQIDDTFKKIFASEIENFKKDYRITHPGKSVENITDAEILREVVNTVGKPGMLGAHIRCVISVSMLTEGWDANTVTHIMGIRAFGSQLLCEQVAGRALRRQNYFLDKSGKFPPEYAHIIGVPFKMFKGGKTTVVPPGETYHILALKERIKYEIRFPQVTGYRIESAEKDILANFDEVEPYEIDGSKYPAETYMGSAFLADKEKMTLQQVKQRREQELIYIITKYMINHYYSDDDKNPQFYKFRQLKEIVGWWYENKVKIIGDAFRKMLFYEDPKSVCNHIMRGIYAEQRKTDRIFPVLNYYNKIGSTKYVNGYTSKKVYATKKSHVNYVVADTDSWEQICAKTLEEMEEVICYVKNSFLGFEIPYIQYGKDKNYLPDFIARVKTPKGKKVNLVIEITGMSQDKEVKKWYVENRWLPAVNNARNDYSMDEWHFIEVANDIRDIKNDLRTKINSLT
jgi:type III restriction enzyme